jgi:hypothetical protein
LRLSQRMASGRELGVDSVCCLLHNLVPGGSGRQWVHLLARHVAGGGSATILAPPGPLGELAREAGIVLVPCSWDDMAGENLDRIEATVSRHDFAVVHWDLGVMDAFGPALEACGRAALVLHQAPQAPARWAGPGIMPSARATVARALADPRSAVLARGNWHRQMFADAFGLEVEEMRVLPASIPLEQIPFLPQLGEPREILALMRLSPDKEAIARLAVELTRRRLAARRPCRLTIAGDGDWREQAGALCEARLPAMSWQIEMAPSDPIARLPSSDLVVAQGLTTLEGAALGRRVVVARVDEEAVGSGVALTPDGYEAAAQDPFGKPPLSEDPGQIWEQILAVGAEDLRRLRHLVETRNGLEAASRALAEAIAVTDGPC